VAQGRPFRCRPVEPDLHIGGLARVHRFDIGLVVEIALAIRIVRVVVEPHPVDIGIGVVVPSFVIAVPVLFDHGAVVIESDTIPDTRVNAGGFELGQSG